MLVLVLALLLLLLDVMHKVPSAAAGTRLHGQRFS